jgi:hypothetical protein
MVVDGEVIAVAADVDAVPLRSRPVDILFVGFFAVNAVVITYAIDLEQLVIADPARLMLSNVLIILMDERYGVTASPRFGVVLAANLSWLVMPVATIVRMRGAEVFPSRPAVPG